LVASRETLVLLFLLGEDLKIFLAGVSSQMQFVASLNTYYELHTEDGDEKATNYNARGDVARITLCNEFLRRPEFDAIFMADLDMKYPLGLLKRLRSHDLDMVTGHYFKRQPNPIQSVVSVSPDGTWPYHPLIDIPDDGLHEIVCAGFGNVLIKRHVIDDVIKLLVPGEHPFQIGPMPEMVDGDHGSFGADFRFFTLARRAGYTLWLDAHIDAEARHAATLWVDRRIYDIMRPHQYKKRREYWAETFKYDRRISGMNKKTAISRVQLLNEHRAEYIRRLEEAEEQTKMYEMALAVVDGQIAEREIDIQPTGAKKIAALPVFASPEEAEDALANRDKGLRGETLADALEERGAVHTEHTSEVLDILEYDYPEDTEEDS
jgi:hypothetical protein